MEVYFWAFIIYEKNNWARLFLIIKFTYNNIKKASIGYIYFELNCNNYSCVLYKKDIDPKLNSKSIDQLVIKLKVFMTICKKNSAVYLKILKISLW